MYTPQGGGRHEQAIDGTGRTRLGKPVESGMCCMVGLSTAALTGFLFYPILVTITQPLRYLSTTAVVFILLFVWFLSWSGTEIILEWRAERIPH